ncbi:MAG: hypothetical protein J7513_06500 [Solirubrobacteraceae bacterium]|nr:hypothetical protein [Solirubrobacteraceae bacterium]
MARQTVFLGDSFTAGQGDASALGWVGRLAQAAAAAGTPIDVINLGLGGATTAEIARHWERAVGAHLASAHTPRLILCAGVNDATSLGGDRTWVAPEVSERSVAAILDRAGALGWPIFVLGPGPACDAAHDARSSELEECFARLCRERAVPFVAILAPLLASGPWRAEAAASDGLHPGAGGYAQLAELVIGAGLVDWLTAPST